MMSTWWWVHEDMKTRSLANKHICWNHINEDVNSKYRMSSPRRSILPNIRTLANILMSWNHMRWGYHLPYMKGITNIPLNLSIIAYHIISTPILGSITHPLDITWPIHQLSIISEVPSITLKTYHTCMNLSIIAYDIHLTIHHPCMYQCITLQHHLTMHHLWYQYDDMSS